MPVLYLAGPDLFRADAQDRAEAMRALARRHGFTPLHPLDSDAPPAATPAAAQAIYLANVAMIRRSDALIANLTPFRGPSADPGTAFELGYMAALGRPVFAWSDAVMADFAERTIRATGARFDPDREAWADAAGAQIESFGLPDNLMLPGPLAAPLVLTGGDAALAGLTACLAQARAWFSLS